MNCYHVQVINNNKSNIAGQQVLDTTGVFFKSQNNWFCENLNFAEKLEFLKTDAIFHIKLIFSCTYIGKYKYKYSLFNS
jgi:hypothetical protein